MKTLLIALSLFAHAYAYGDILAIRCTVESEQAIHFDLTFSDHDVLMNGLVSTDDKIEGHLFLSGKRAVVETSNDADQPEYLLNLKSRSYAKGYYDVVVTVTNTPNENSKRVYLGNCKKR